MVIYPAIARSVNGVAIQNLPSYSPLKNTAHKKTAGYFSPAAYLTFHVSRFTFHVLQTVAQVFLKFLHKVFLPVAYGRKLAEEESKNLRLLAPLQSAY